MLTISTFAGARMAELLSPKTSDAVLRIVRRERRLRLRCSQLRSGDQTFSHDGRVVLALDSRMRKLLDSRHLDVRQTEEGSRLQLVADSSNAK